LRSEGSGYDYSNCVRILVLHAWLKGNLGDVLQLSVLLSALRDLQPARLDLAGYPEQPAPETGEVIERIDRYLPDTFPWYWKLAPASVGRIVFEPWWRRRRTALFSEYDAIVCAPGPYLADYDPRAISALADIAIAAEMGLRVVLSSHSIGPLSAGGRAVIARATARIARESSTFEYLRERGIGSVLAADLAFLYRYAPAGGPDGIRPPYRLVFLRSNNLKAKRLRLDRGALFDGTRPIADASSDPVVLATSDYRRDARFLAHIARTLGVPWVACRSVQELVRLVAASSSVVSDRYHPAICAAVLGKPAHVLSNREPHKMRGLTNLLAGHGVEDLQALARTGLRAVQQALRVAEASVQP